jgi:outer membrane protein OmpA-like peptidoglycan-associated protein
MRTPLLVALAACAGSPPATVVGAPITAVSAVTTTVPLAREDLTAPFSLTASDGSGLVLTRVDAKAVMEGPLAFTELHLWFRNTEARNREGTFQITLPQHAAISRFAMEGEDHLWMEAEVVPKLVARRAYEDFLHRRQDPALLEKAAGNQFTARVFPIFAHAEKHLVISYSQELPGQRYTLPLRGLPRVSRVDVQFAHEGTVETLAQRDWIADRDFASANATSAAAVGATGLVAAQIEIAGAATRDVPRGITLLVDTSASRALGFERYVRSIKKLAADLRATWGDALPLQLVAFDQDTQRIFDGRIDELGDAAFQALLDRGAAGASNLGQAFSTLRDPQPRVVVVTDGVITAGPEGAALHAPRGVERIDVVLAGGLRDDRAAQTLVRSLPRAGAVLDLDTDPVATALGETVTTNIAIDVSGASWVYPRAIPSARTGTKVMVFARASGNRIDITAGGVTRTLHVLPGTQPLVERAVAGAELEELEATLANARGDAAMRLRTQIAAKSVAARVLSRETSMLVLESEHDYPRYGIDRKALANVLVVGARGVERVHRSDITRIPTRVGKATDTDTVEPRSRSTADTDRDAILDVDDRCPTEPESYNGLDDDDGCPDRGRIVVTDASITILEPVTFKDGSGVIAPSSFPILDAVAETMLGNPDIQLVELQGHTDERGDDAANLALSDRRAMAVRDYLIAKDVAAQRLVAQGYGETQPIDRRHTPTAWARNRRVDFLILRRDASRNFTGKHVTTNAPAAVTGTLAEIQQAIAANHPAAALATARDWQAREPGNVLAIVGLGEALEANRKGDEAARVYGSIIDLFPGRADLRRFAGERLGRLANPLAIDTFRRAVADRPDHLTGHRLLAYALVRANQHADAFAAILAALGERYRETSFRGGRRVLGEDAAMIGAAYALAVPAKRADIVAALANHQLVLATRPSTRFVAYWETDANDVDLHVTDVKGNTASYQSPKLPSGGELYADVTNGYGPECFAIDGAPKAGPYQLSIHYYAQGPMGYGMGLVQIQRFDPARGLTFEDRPYLIMTPHARVDLGTVR